MTKPISPSEVPGYKTLAFPPYVFEAFNELIAKGYCNRTSTVKQNDVIDLILAKANKGLDSWEIDDGSGLTRQEIFDRGFLNVEDVYRAEGWKVEYDKPGYNETYGAFFKFRSVS